ncbi:glycosyltransferase family 4 protein [Flavobacterium agrisoli]|uniref:Glycosyltransferase family 4 protein n=1 Tax=Flavobacterium agrisoli TaxID=2793066 RepID=A0A934UKM8_9FLAO|nr:glycosyltransferase family 1 protein [Flavobacterium agrisoli]MBK0371266.1 glycosyltransferase family 4 protein [Flavobacterium agrisoli]
MNIEIDNIIFSLQKAGGISVVWQQHLKRLLNDAEFNCRIIEYEGATANFFRQQLAINNQLIDSYSNDLLALKRFLNLKSQNKEKHLFHSSYYRTQKGKNVINITTVHDFTYEYYRKGMSKTIHSWQKNAAITNAQGIICISESTKRDLQLFLPSIKPENIRVIYNGVDEVYQQLKQEQVLTITQPFEDFSYALYVGDRKSLYKNFDMAVATCKLANMRLLIIGGGPLSENEQYNLNSKLGKDNYKELLHVSEADLNCFYNKAYCLLYPSFYEGFGMPIVEAQKAGCPVIATNASSIPEVIGNHYFAVTDPNAQKLADKIKELSFNNSVRNETIEQGLLKAQQFNWQNSYNQTIEFYKEVYNK